LSIALPVRECYAPAQARGRRGRTQSCWYVAARNGIEALYRKPNLSRKHLAHKIWPYVRNRNFERSNQVFALDRTYMPMAHGFVYLTAVIDWASRRLLAHRLAITMEA
jgi:hypothetical protein